MELLRLSVNKKFQIVFAGDYNHNLLGDTAADFLVGLHVNFLHPVITISECVTPISATLIDNFMCDISMLPIQSSIIVHDISDHYPILLHLQIPENNYAFRRNYSKHNKDLFSAKLMNADWTHLYTLTDTNAAFIYFIKKIKRKYHESFPFTHLKHSNKNNLWMTKEIMKLIKYKNTMYKKYIAHKINKSDYVTCRNNTTNTIRNAKTNYHKNLLTNLSNNTKKLWSALNSIINTRCKVNIPLSAEDLNNYFVSVYKMAPKYNSNYPMTIKEYPVQSSLFLHPTDMAEILQITNSIKKTHAVGADGMDPNILKEIIHNILPQLVYLCNLSFKSGVFPDTLKLAIIAPVHKAGTYKDASNYRPISILSLFSKILEKIVL